jgi:hypothetical protein
MDKGERPGSKLAQIAGVTAVIKGQEGGGRPVSARVLVHPATLQPLLAFAPAEQLPADQQRVLDVHCGYKGGYRREELSRDAYVYAAPGNGRVVGVRTPGMTDAQIDACIAALVASGHLAKNKAGAVSVTTKGKNARSKRF